MHTENPSESSMKSAVVLLFLILVLASAVDFRAGVKPQDPQQTRNDDTTPLMRASEAGRIEDVRGLLKSGADPNETIDRLGITALMYAAGRGHLEVVKILLKAGADPNAAGGVVHVGFFSVMNMAINPRNKNRLEVVDALIAAGALLNPPQSFPAAPLCAAVSGQDIEMIKALLKRGSDVNWENQIGTTPLVTAVLTAKPNVEIVRLLLDAGADPNKPRLWIGEDCVSILKSLDPVPGTPRDRIKEEIRQLIIRAGGKKYARNSHGEPCKN